MTEGGTYVPFLAPWPHVPHYYGDIVRQCFVIGAVAMLIGAPFYSNDVRTELPFLILGTLILIGLAALTNPHTKSVIMADAIVAGVLVLVYQVWALFEYQSSTWLASLLREIIAIIFITAFYFSMKTLRAMMLHQIGKREELGEFDEKS